MEKHCTHYPLNINVMKDKNLVQIQKLCTELQLSSVPKIRFYIRNLPSNYSANDHARTTFQIQNSLQCVSCKAGGDRPRPLHGSAGATHSQRRHSLLCRAADSMLCSAVLPDSPVVACLLKSVKYFTFI